MQLVWAQKIVIADYLRCLEKLALTQTIMDIKLEFLLSEKIIQKHNLRKAANVVNLLLVELVVEVVCVECEWGRISALRGSHTMTHTHLKPQ